MGYISELRRLVGHRPLIMPGVCIVVKDDRGRILLQKRADTGMWSTIGGGMEPGESFEETARRELYEEAGIRISALAMRTVLSGESMFYTYPNGDQVYNVIAVFDVAGWEGTAKVHDDESLEFASVTFEEARDMLHPFSLKILERSGYYDQGHDG